MKTYPAIILALLFSILFLNCESPAEESDAEATFSVDFEQYTLDNGLQVVLHVDRSDPVVAVALTSHVGSAREKEGRTGFAHLFEHLLFLESENLGKGGLDKMSARIGGSGANGSTSRDRTNYFQTVPKDALEKMIWAEADKLGWFINTVTEPVLAKEKQVVKNEKRQGVDNQPYGHTSYVIDNSLYPAGHPYSWQVIGSLEDLQNATLQDVKDFYRRWYVPNNVTLVIAGDFEVAQAKEWVEKYFGEIARGEDVPPLEKQPANLAETKKLYHEDNFARLPELTLTWPSVYQYHPDAYPLEVLATYLSDGKKAPFYQVLVEELKITDRVNMYQYGSELAGQFAVRVRAFTDTDLDTVAAGVETAFAKFEEEGITEEDLDRIKARQETAFYRSLSSVLGKAFQLAQYQIFADDPGFINQDVKNILAVTTADVQRVYEQYIKGKPFVATSFVPKGQRELALEGSKKAEVVEEAIVQGAEESFDLSDTVAYTRTPSNFDRTIEPPYGDSPNIKVPAVWESVNDNGMRVYGIQNDEVPLVEFMIMIEGGQLLDDPAKPGVANLVAEMLNKGTKNKTAQELEAAIDKLGARINVFAQPEAIVIAGNSLARHYAATMELVNEMILQPRWDTEEYALLQQSTLSRIQQQSANPGSIANQNFQKLLYGEDHVLAQNILGTESSVNAISLGDLQAYYNSKLAPSLASIHVVGDITQEEVLVSLRPLVSEWEGKEIAFPELPEPQAPAASQVYFYDVPGAKQSVLRFGYPALKATDNDYYPAQVMNYRLGGGGFASQLTQELREGKGYTYGIRSSFSGSDRVGDFEISSGVRSNVTYESAALVKEILENYGPNYNEEDLEVTKSFMIKSNARAFETANAKLNMLENISSLGLPYDYAKKREKIVQKMTVERIKELAATYLKPGQMYYLVVGDAATQLERLRDLGFGEVVLLNEQPLQ